jgi:cytochrome c oxidase subunit 2
MSATAAVGLLLAAEPGGSLILPPEGSTLAGKMDTLFYFILALTTFFFLLVVGLVVYFTVRYRKRPGQRTSAVTHHRGLEVAWSAIPAVLFVFIFGWGFQAYMHLSVPPANALDVRVTGQKWLWSFDYPKEGIQTTKDLVVPVGRPVRLTMSSQDVIHGFYVPAFRIKRDVLPNRYTVAWFEAKEPGEYDLFCTQYCGTGHSGMLGKIVVKTEQQFKEWVASGGGMSGQGMSGVQFGRMLFEKMGCVSCHSTDGSPRVGPSLLNKYGSKELLSTGNTVLVDDNYVRESIQDPLAQVVNGFQPVMPTFRGRLNDRQIDALIDFIKSLKR